MDENTVNRTRASINALIDIEQLWIENTPDYKLSTQDMLILKKRLERTIDNVTKIYESHKPELLAAEEEIKKMHAGKKNKKNK